MTEPNSAAVRPKPSRPPFREGTDWRRISRLLSRTLCIAAIPTVVFAFYDPFFFPLSLKEIYIQAIGAMALLCWWVGLRPPGPTFLPNPLQRPLYYLCLFALLSIVWAPAKAIAFSHWVAILCLFMLFPPMFDYGKTRRFRNLYLTTALSVTMVLLLLSSLQLNGISLENLLRVAGGNPRTRLSLTIGHNNGVAPILLFSSFLAISAMAHFRGWASRLAFASFVASCWLLILFFLLTRSTILGLIIGASLFLGMNLWALIRKHQTASPRLYRGLKWSLAVSVGLVIGVIGFSIYEVSQQQVIEGSYNPNLAINFIERLQTFRPEFLSRDSRARLWTISMHMMKHYPLLGVGFSGAKIHYPFYQAVFFEHFPDFPAGPTVNHTEGVHNDYLQWAVECGMLGLTILIWLFCVLAKVFFRWLRSLPDKPLAQRFEESAIIVGCVCLCLDAFFSFPAHIAPIAIYVPGLLMLWMGCIFQGHTTGPSSGFLRSAPTGAKLAIAGLVWLIFFVPFRTTTEKIPLLTRSGIWSPLPGQIVGSTWHARLAGVRPELRNQMTSLRDRMLSGNFVSAQETSALLGHVQRFLQRNQQVADLIPYSGDAVFDSASGFYDAYRFFRATRDRANQVYSAIQPVPEDVLKAYARTGDVLLQTEKLFVQALQNYRYHSLYWLLGMSQLDHAMLSGIAPEQRDSLTQTGLDNLAAGRRIFTDDERLLAEIDVNLIYGREENGGQRIAQLLALSPRLIERKAIPNLMRRKLTADAETGLMKYEQSALDFYSWMLPQLNKGHLRIIRDAIPALAQGNALDLAREYVKLEDELAPQPFGIPFWEMKLVQPPGAQEKVDAMLEGYRAKIRENPRLAALRKAFFLSDLQRFAPPGIDLSAWEREVQSLLETDTGNVARPLCLNMLASNSLSQGRIQQSWEYFVKSISETSEKDFPLVADRRYAALSAALWGAGFPWLGN